VTKVAFNGWRRSETHHRFPLAAARSKSFTPKAQATFAAIDFLSVAGKANKAAPLQPPKDLEKKLRLGFGRPINFLPASASQARCASSKIMTFPDGGGPPAL
jgi:hypothetical protein